MGALFGQGAAGTAIMVLDFDYRGHALHAEADGQIESRDHDTSSPPDVNPGLVGWPFI